MPQRFVPIKKLQEAGQLADAGLLWYWVSGRRADYAGGAPWVLCSRVRLADNVVYLPDGDFAVLVED